MADLAYEVAKQRIEQQATTRQTRADLQREITALRGDNARLAEHNAALQAGQQRLETQLAELQSSIERLREEHKHTAMQAQRAAAQSNELTARTQDVNQRVTDLNTKVNQNKDMAQAANSLALERAKSLKLELQLEHKRLQDRVDVLADRERSLAERHQALDARQLEAAKATTTQNRYWASIERFRSNEPDYQVFARHLSKEELEAFSREAREIFGLDLEPRSIAYMAHRIRQIESNSIGRLATSIHAALTRAMALLSLADERLQYVEIGVLFGINTAIVWDLLRYRFQSTRITCIDPLEGYYDASALDKLTGLPINETVLKQNLKRALCDMRQVTILKGLSEDAEILAEASRHRYNYLLIDGDHSYDGVRRDFENYAPLVTPGGIVAIDDYGAPEWPEVTAYADRFLMDLPEYDVLSKQHRTLILRKR